MRLGGGVHLLELRGGNAYLAIGGRKTLIDTGMPGRGRDLLGQIESALPDAGGLDDVLLTHHDVDHVGNLRAVQERFGARAFMSAEDIPYAVGEMRRPGVKRVIAAVLRPAAPLALEPLDRYPNPEIEVVPTPGHTPGHVAFRFRDFLFTGDLFHVEDGHIAPTRRAMNWDARIMGESAMRVAEADAAMLCPAHGLPVELTETVRHELREVGATYAGR